MAAKLKVYRTPIGFHDAYVAAPSQKAALAAWGADANLFARGVAELVTDAALTKDPLAHPGEVIRVVRGTAAEHIAALPKSAPKPAARKAARPMKAPPPKPKPRPSRQALDKAEAALTEAERRHASALDEIRNEETALASRRRALERERADDLTRLKAAEAAARKAYDGALTRWRAD